MSWLSTIVCNQSTNTIANGANSLSRVETAFLVSSDVRVRNSAFLLSLVGCLTPREEARFAYTFARIFHHLHGVDICN